MLVSVFEATWRYCSNEAGSSAMPAPGEKESFSGETTLSSSVAAALDGAFEVRSTTLTTFGVAVVEGGGLEHRPPMSVYEAQRRS